VGSGIASALLIADLFLVPVTPSAVDVRATGKALELLHRARAVRAGIKPACMLVPSRVDRRTVIGRSIHGTLARFGLRVGPSIRQRAVHAEAFNAGAWIGEHAPTSPAYREIRLLKDRVIELMEEVDRPSPKQPAPIASEDVITHVPPDPMPAVSSMPFHRPPAREAPEVQPAGR
jgi:cellulose biosynthesis protein BcsQ